MCLQWSALGDRTGAVVLARIVEDGLGSRVHGRAGFDLASLGLIGVVAGVVIFSMYELAVQSTDVASLLLFSAVFLLVPGAVLWLRIASPEDAEPLVRFLRRVLETPAVCPSQHAPSHFGRTPVQSVRLNVDGQDVAAPSEDDLSKAILAMKPESFLIIDFGSNNFMQTVFEYDRFILEKCDGSDHELYRAKGDFDRNDVIAVMTTYLRGSQSSLPIVWEMQQG